MDKHVRAILLLNYTHYFHTVVSLTVKNWNSKLSHAHKHTLSPTV